ncbi:MAG: urea ABC transporter permease subunit UrtB [Gammaproteobacteria bacterium]|jgi:urea transport system permease protein
MALFSTPMLVKSLLALLLSATLSMGFSGELAASEMALEQAWQALGGKNYKQKAMAIESIVQNNPPEALAALKALLEGQLFIASKNNQLFIMREIDNNYEFTPLFEGEAVTQAKKRGFKKIRINNRLRILIRQSLALMQLKHADVAVRFAAVQELLKQPDPEIANLVESMIQNEKDVRVLAAMQTLLAINQLANDDEGVQEKAIETLSESLNPSALNALDSYAAPNQALEKQTRMAIRKINEQRDLYAKAETIFFGLSLGSVLALAAIGLAITFGVMGVINMAHGELMMIGAYTTYVIQQLMPGYIGASIIVAIPAAFIVSGLVGIAIERGVIRHLYGRPLETLLATFGISLILQQVVRSIFSPLNRSVETPQWMSGAWQFNEVFALTWNRFYIIIFSVAVFVALIMVMKKTTLGLQVRAVSQNRTMARAMGVRSEWVDALTFGLGSGIAGMAGVALSLLTNVGPNLGQSYIIDSFMVVVFGGVGNLWGTLIAGMSLGVINKALEPWAGAVLAKILVLVFIILFIQKRPKGLFPQRGRAAED